MAKSRKQIVGRTALGTPTGQMIAGTAGTSAIAGKFLPGNPLKKDKNRIDVSDALEESQREFFNIQLKFFEGEGRKALYLTEKNIRPEITGVAREISKMALGQAQYNIGQDIKERREKTLAGIRASGGFTNSDLARQQGRQAKKKKEGDTLLGSDSLLTTTSERTSILG